MTLRSPNGVLNPPRLNLEANDVVAEHALANDGEDAALGLLTLLGADVAEVAAVARGLIG